jgi:hypothetical protein
MAWVWVWEGIGLGWSGHVIIVVVMCLYVMVVLFLVHEVYSSLSSSSLFWFYLSGFSYSFSSLHIMSLFSRFKVFGSGIQGYRHHHKIEWII